MTDGDVRRIVEEVLAQRGTVNGEAWQGVNALARDGGTSAAVATGGGTGLKGTWELKFAAGVGTFSACRWFVSPLTKGVGDIEYTVAGPDGIYYLAAKIDLAADTAEIVKGATVESVTDEAVPEGEDRKYVKVLLYRIERKTAGGVVRCRKMNDYRNMPAVGVYV